MEMTKLLAAGLLALALAGCSSLEPEPEAAFTELEPQTYPFMTVWESLLEAAEREGFEIETSGREGETGRFVTDFVVTFDDPLKDVKRAERLHVRVRPGGAEGAYGVAVAASRFRWVEGEESGWSWVGTDAALLERYRETLYDSLGRRYRREEEEEGWR